MSLRVAFLGNDPWSVPALEAIVGEPELEVGLVLTNPPRPAGRGGALRSTDVALAAARLGVPLVEAVGVRQGDGAAAINRVGPEVLVVVAYGHLLPVDLLETTPHGALNVHFSLLPRWRGATPVQHALLAGDAVTGVTVMQIDAGLDTGPILSQLEEPIRPEDNAGSLGGRLAALGAMLVVGVLRRLPGGDVPARAQPVDGVTLAPVLSSGARRIDWSASATTIARQVRAFAPEPGAATVFRATPMKVLRAAADHGPIAAPGGTIVDADARGVLVAAGEGGLRLLEVAPSGRRRMTAGDWARGARFAPGERLG